MPLHSPRRRDPDRLALLLLILVAGVIRLWGIGEKALWVDEAHALVDRVNR